VRTEVVPAILAQSEEEFRERIRLIERVAPLVQVDVMDGRFVPNTTWADPLVVARIATPARFEVHLMVEEPFREVILWGKLKNVRRTIVHAESCPDRSVGATTQLRTLLHTIRATGKEVGLAVNPGTPLEDIHPFLQRPGLPRPRSTRARNDRAMVDFLLVMSNDPGFSGRPFRRATLKRIAALRKRFPLLPIGVDIGVTAETAPLLRAAGATHIAAASAIFGQPDPVAAYRELQRAFGAQRES